VGVGSDLGNQTRADRPMESRAAPQMLIGLAWLMGMLVGRTNKFHIIRTAPPVEQSACCSRITKVGDYLSLQYGTVTGTTTFRSPRQLPTNLALAWLGLALGGLGSSPIYY
jgi:hypothetical protein